MMKTLAIKNLVGIFIEKRWLGDTQVVVLQPIFWHTQSLIKQPHENLILSDNHPFRFSQNIVLKFIYLFVSNCETTHPIFH